MFDLDKAEYGKKYDAMLVYLDLVRRLAEAGHTDQFMADFFGVKIGTWHYWKSAHKEFRHALNVWKTRADERVERALYEKAIGYEHEESKVMVSKDGKVKTIKVVKKFPPSDSAIFFWLKNRQKERWKDKFDHEMAGGIENKNILVQKVEMPDIEDRIKLLEAPKEDEKEDAFEAALQ